MKLGEDAAWSEISEAHFMDLLELCSGATRHRARPLAAGPASLVLALLILAKLSRHFLTPVYLVVCFWLILIQSIEFPGPGHATFLVGLISSVCLLVATMRTWIDFSLTPTLDLSKQLPSVIRILVTVPRTLIRWIATFFTPFWLALPMEISKSRRQAPRSVTSAMVRRESDSAYFSSDRSPRLQTLLQKVAGATGSQPWDRLCVGSGGKYQSRRNFEREDVLELPGHDLQALTTRELLGFLLSSSWHKEDPARVRLLRAQRMLDTLELERGQLQALGRYRFLDLYYLQVLIFCKWARSAVDKIEREHEVAALQETAHVIGVEETIQFCRKNHGAQIWADSDEARGLNRADQFYETAGTLDATGPSPEVALDIADAFDKGGQLEYLTSLFLDLRQSGLRPRIADAVEPSMTAWDVMLGDRELYPSRWAEQ
ncbi:MAG: hypothetical protein ACI8Q9_002492 [Planctomycetota bacterium]|jgi:hypothetical protein